MLSTPKVENLINQQTKKFLTDLEILRSASQFKRDKEIADILEMSTGNFSQVLHGKRNRPKEKLKKFYTHFESFVFKKEDAKNYTTQDIVDSKNEIIESLAYNNFKTIDFIEK